MFPVCVAINMKPSSVYRPSSKVLKALIIWLGIRAIYQQDRKGKKWGGNRRNSHSDILSGKIHLSLAVSPAKSVRISVKDLLLHHLADVKPK